MGLPAEKHARATYADLEAVAEGRVAEIINGVLHAFPRPAPRHAGSSSRIGMRLGGPFDLGDGGPGGFWILDEPELHFGPEDGFDVLVPDLAAWRRERMPRLPGTAYFTLVPDWVCEVLSSSTETIDRTEKMPIYAREGVKYAWLLNPVRQTLEAYRLNAEGQWVLLAAHAGASRARIEPFDAIEIDLSIFWAPVEGDETEAPREDEEPRPRAPKGKPKKKNR